jgi:hypothetical protein
LIRKGEREILEEYRIMQKINNREKKSTIFINMEREVNRNEYGKWERESE